MMRYSFIIAAGLCAAHAAAQLPAWVPGTVGQAGLVPMTNRLDDVDLTGVWSGDSPANFTDYSGGCYNPYYGQWGAHIIHGGGHAGTNDNSVFIANFNTLAFERVGGPTQLPTKADYENRISTGGFPDDMTNPREVADGVPGSAHTYDCLLTLPPSVCGDPLGALIRPVSSAVGVSASRTSGWSHVFTFTNRQWSRWSTNYARSWGPGGTCAYDTQRGVIWPIADGNMTYRSYLTLSNRTFTNLNDQPGLNSYPDMVYSTYCANRDIVVIATNNDGESNIRFYWFSAASTGGTRTPVSFSTGSLPQASWGRGSIMYVPELQKVIYWTQYSIDTYYEIDVPANPSSAWSWVSKSITGAAKPSTLSPAPSGSTYHRMDYAPQLKSLVWVTAQNANTFVFGGRVVCIRIVPDGSRIEAQVKAGEEIRVSPNPFSGSVSLHLQLNHKADFALYNAAGVRVRACPAARNSVRWSTGDIPAGVYFLKAAMGKTVVTEKIVKF